MPPVAAERDADEPPEHQLVQVQGIGLIDRNTTLEPPSPDGEQGFKNGIEQHSQRVERRNTRVAHDELYGQLGQHEAQEIGAAVTQEDASERKIDRKR